MNKDLKTIIMLSALASQAYMPEFRKVKDIEVLTECPKCHKEFNKVTPKYCDVCKTRLWVK